MRTVNSYPNNFSEFGCILCGETERQEKKRRKNSGKLVNGNEKVLAVEAVFGQRVE